MIKKFIIIALLTFFMISAVSASDINETVSNEYAESKIQEFVEVNQPDFEEIEIDDVVVNDVIREDNTPIKINQEYNDSYIINDCENDNGIENYQYNGTYIESLINDTLNNDTVLDLNISLISYYIFDKFMMGDEISIFMKFNILFKNINFSSSLSKFKEINKFKLLSHEDFIFYNNYCHILTNDVGKNTVFLSDKLHTKFAFSIDNSILGSADDFAYFSLNSYFSNFNAFSLSFFQTFSNFVQIFIKINYNEYSFFPK